MSAACPPASPEAAPEDRRRRCERRARRGELVVRAGRASGLGAVVAVDRRTRLGRALAAFRASLLRHTGGQPSETQAALIEVAAQVKARLLVMDADFAARGAMSAHAGREYLAWSNSLARTLRQLGMKGAPAPMPSLAEILAMPHG